MSKVFDTNEVLLKKIISNQRLLLDIAREILLEIKKNNSKNTKIPEDSDTSDTSNTSNASLRSSLINFDDNVYKLLYE